jgi:hypothetical protein
MPDAATPEPVSTAHGLLLAAFAAQEKGDTEALANLAKLAENPEAAARVVEEAHQLATMRDPEEPATAPDTFLR